MPPTKTATPPLARPATHRKHPTRAPAAPTDARWFLWYAGPCAGALSRVVPRAGNEPLAHWLPPATPPGGRRPGPPAWAEKRAARARA